MKFLTVKHMRNELLALGITAGISFALVMLNAPEIVVEVVVLFGIPLCAYAIGRVRNGRL